MMHALRLLLVLIKILKREVIKYKLIQNHCKYNLRKHFFTNRIVAIWNSLPSHVVDADSINIFKNRLDSHWCMQDIMYDFDSELTGIGNRSFE